MNDKVRSGQEHETATAREIIICGRAMTSKAMGALHPAGSLYEKPINLKNVEEQHHRFRTVLEDHGIVVHDVRDILAMDVDHSVGDRMDLEDLAMKTLAYRYEKTEEDDPKGGEKWMYYVCSSISHLRMGSNREVDVNVEMGFDCC